MDDINALIASAIPVIPPDDWFENPRLDRPTAIRVAPDGRVFGHVASWNTNHIGMPHGVRPPRNQSGYAYFKTGEIQTASGNLLPCGQLTLSGGHADLAATASQAVKHYDDTQSAIADVTVGEDSHGIWVAGAVRPSATAEQIRALRASAPSGDWRMINGRLEMVAVCQVNVPGFPIPRALAASGERVSLVAAGSLPLLAQVLAEQEFEARLQRLEILHQQREDDKLALIASAAKDRMRTLREATVARQAEMARLRVRDPEEYRRRTQLSASVSGGRRDKAAKSGHALPDGSFPIDNISDLKKAIKAYGRAKSKSKAMRHIIKRAHALGATKALPEHWTEHLTASGTFDYLPAGFLSDKASQQTRDGNGRFLNKGAVVRWRNGDTYAYGQVLNGATLSDGQIAIRLAGAQETVKMDPKSIEKIRAVLPAVDVDHSNDRGVPFLKGEGHGQQVTQLSSEELAEAGLGGNPDEWEDDPGYPVIGFQVGDPVAHVDGYSLGNVTDASDPAAIEVTDADGLVSAHPVDEIQLDTPDGYDDDEDDI